MLQALYIIRLGDFWLIYLAGTAAPILNLWILTDGFPSYCVAWEFTDYWGPVLGQGTRLEPADTALYIVRQAVAS